MYFDTHAHLDDKQFNDDLEQVIEQSIYQGITAIVNVGITMQSSRRAIALAQKYPLIYASVGVHPHDAKSMKDEKHWLELAELARQPRVVALGEMGLDYYHNFSEPKVQQEVFRRQLALAKKLELPVIIHDREAHQDILDILTAAAKEDNNLTGVLHCFSGSWEMAKKCLELNFYISLAGPVTFANAVKPKEIAKKVPLDRLFIETDCPYLTPHPHRGRRNYPGYVKLVAEEIASLRGLAVEELAQATKENGFRLFNIHQTEGQGLV
jgi:TatD DNase family protein